MIDIVKIIIIESLTVGFEISINIYKLYGNKVTKPVLLEFILFCVILFIWLLKDLLYLLKIIKICWSCFWQIAIIKYKTK